MPYLQIEPKVVLHYKEHGEGIPIIFLHGVWMSSEFFKKQIPYFSKKYKIITLDFRGHGKSSHPAYGHTINQYAKDLQKFIELKQLKNVVLVGWSMGAFVIWEYLKNKGEENIKGTVIIDEMASDFKWADFPIGAFDFNTLISFMRSVQTERVEFLKGFIPLMFKNEISEEELLWMLKETTAMSESIASAILFDQSVVDYRKDIATFQNPCLLCFGKEEKLIPLAAGVQIKEAQKNATLEIFHNSCHCPFLEEPELFNKKVDDFISNL